MDDEKLYFYKRAEVELDLAQAANRPEVVKVHYTLASYYLEKVYEEVDIEA